MSVDAGWQCSIMNAEYIRMLCLNKPLILVDKGIVPRRLEEPGPKMEAHHI